MKLPDAPLSWAERDKGHRAALLCACGAELDPTIVEMARTMRSLVRPMCGACTRRWAEAVGLDDVPLIGAR